MDCCDKSGCAHPEKQQRAEACTSEQIRECHGDVQAHPCACTPERVHECHGEVQDHPCERVQ